MRAMAVTALGERLRPVDIPDPRVEPDGVVVDVRACGVCYTDVKVAEQLAPHLPLVPGHEAVGLVAEVGSRVDGLRIGDRVAIHAVVACERCAACVAGRQQACVRGLASFGGIGLHGGYAPAVAVPAATAIPLPDELGFVDAAPLLCAGLTSYSGLRSAGVGPGDRVAIIGVGGLGHLAISIAAALGAEVFAVTSSPSKIPTAVSRGAVFAGEAAAVADAVADRGGLTVVLNTANHLGPLTHLMPSLAVGARVVLVAGDDAVGVGISPSDIVGKQLHVIGSFFGSRQELRELLGLATEHRIRSKIEPYRTDDVNIAHDRLRANDVRFRAVLDRTT